jgi:tetratricopeptide (TPR) repeat protein
MMDYSKEYQVALELASALRYEEAGQKLKLILEEHPDNMDALILLGKVEYYLGLFPSSRRRFETVLTHDPGNFEAYYGLRFFTERKRRLWTITAWLTSIFLFLSIAVFLNISIRAGFNRFEESFSEQNGYYYEALKETAHRLKDRSY